MPSADGVDSNGTPAMSAAAACMMVDIACTSSGAIVNSAPWQSTCTSSTPSTTRSSSRPTCKRTPRATAICRSERGAVGAEGTAGTATSSACAFCHRATTWLLAFIELPLLSPWLWQMCRCPRSITNARALSSFGSESTSAFGLKERGSDAPGSGVGNGRTSSGRFRLRSIATDHSLA